MCDRLKMRWVTTCPISALMINLEPFRDGTDEVLIDEDVR